MKRILLSIFVSAIALISHAKSYNLVIVNNLIVENEKPDISEVYVVPAKDTHGNLRKNTEIEWGKNLLKDNIDFGDYEKFKCYDDPLMRYDIKIVFEGKTSDGKPMQYFHHGCCLFENGHIIHQWITSLKDGSSPWKGGDCLLRDEMRKMNKKYDD